MRMQVRWCHRLIGGVEQFVVLMAVCTSFFAWSQHSPVGAWKTVDDKTGKARAVMRLVETNGVISGRIERGYNPAEDNRVCTACPDERKGQLLRGMEVVRGMRAHGEQWGGGEVLDPDNGMTYSCRMRLIDGGARLEVRGYLGISLFGRTQVWERLE